jgi:hypothetical protein
MMARKHVTDVMVCQAYADAKAMLPKVPVGHIFGIGPPLPATPFPYDLLMERTGECFKVCWRAMERACDRDLIEYGVSLRTGWLTEKGEALLRTTHPEGEKT